MGYVIEHDIAPHVSVRLDNHGGEPQERDRDVADRLRAEAQLALESLIDGDVDYRRIATVC